MKTIPFMKTFATEELVNLLHACGEYLHEAYQASQDNDLWEISERAYQASNYLLCEIHRHNNHITH